MTKPLKGPFALNDEPSIIRTISLRTGSRIASFSDAVRQRDRRCVITGTMVSPNYNRGFQSAHVFPLAYEGEWRAKNYERWITIAPTRPSHGTINSVQNGLLLRCDIHDLFDSFLLSIDPDVCISVILCNGTTAYLGLRTTIRSSSLTTISMACPALI
jgi:hypothetical protein